MLTRKSLLRYTLLLWFLIPDAAGFRLSAQTELAAWWPLDESAGSVAADGSGNGISANMTAVTWAPGAGRIDGAAVFDGQQTRGQFTLPAWDMLAFAVWVNFNGDGDSRFPGCWMRKISVSESSGVPPANPTEPCSWPVSMWAEWWITAAPPPWFRQQDGSTWR